MPSPEHVRPRPSVPSLPSPRRGGLRTPVRMTRASLRRGPVRPPALRLPPMIILCLALRPALPCGRGDRAPPRKPPLASSPALPRKAILARTVHPWRGGLRTPVRMTRASLRHGPVRPPALRLPPMIMLCLALRPALPCGRGDRAPPRKTPLALSPGFPR